MDRSSQEEADRRYDLRIQETGARDPREFYRDILKDLRETDAEAYQEMVARYQAEVVAPLAEGSGDPLLTWLEFGRALAQRTAPGRLVRVDATGRAEPVQEELSWGDLLLHLPDQPRGRALPVGIPPEPTPAQRATLDLLVTGRVRLPEPD